MYTTNEVADMFGVSLKTVQWWCRERWSGEKTGRDYMLTKKDLKEFAERRKPVSGESDVARIARETRRSLPTVYKAIKEAGCILLNGIYVLTDVQVAEVIARLKEKR